MTAYNGTDGPAKAAGGADGGAASPMEEDPAAKGGAADTKDGAGDVDMADAPEVGSPAALQGSCPHCTSPNPQGHRIRFDACVMLLSVHMKGVHMPCQVSNNKTASDSAITFSLKGLVHVVLQQANGKAESDHETEEAASPKAGVQVSAHSQYMCCCIFRTLVHHSAVC